MKFLVEKRELLKGLTLANSVVERASTIPILANVLLVAAEGALTVVATDLDVQIKLTLNADVRQAGRISVSASMLQDIVKKLADGAQVECELVDSLFHVKSGRSRLKMFSLPADDFPDFDAGKPTTQFSLDSVDLVRLLRKTSFAISTEASRYYLNGVYMHLREGNFACVATDGHRMAVAWVKAEGLPAHMPGVILPRKTTLLAARHIDGHDGAVTIRLSETKIAFEWGNTVLVSKLIDGSFPDYDRVIPKTNGNRLRVDVKALTASVDRVATVSPEKGRVCSFRLEQSILEVAMNVPEGGTAEDRVDVQYEGDEMVIGFNTRYVLEALANIGADSVVWEMGDPGCAVILRPQIEDANFMSIIMPMRVA